MIRIFVFFSILLVPNIYYISGDYAEELLMFLTRMSQATGIVAVLLMFLFLSKSFFKDLKIYKLTSFWGGAMANLIFAIIGIEWLSDKIYEHHGMLMSYWIITGHLLYNFSHIDLMNIYLFERK